MTANTNVKLGTVQYRTETAESEQDHLYYDLAMTSQSPVFGVIVGVLRDANDPSTYVVVFRHIPDDVYDTIKAEESRVKLDDGRFLRWKAVCGPISIQYNPVTEVVEA